MILSSSTLFLMILSSVLADTSSMISVYTFQFLFSNQNTFTFHQAHLPRFHLTLEAQKYDSSASISQYITSFFSFSQNSLMIILKYIYRSFIVFLLIQVIFATNVADISSQKYLIICNDFTLEILEFFL
jgi:hypothetical protein